MFSCFPIFFAVPLHKRNKDNRRASRTRLEGVSKPYTTFCLTFNTIYTMAKITPIDVIKGISGKYGGNSNDYFATNKSSNKVHLAKLANPYQGPYTEKQMAQREKFTTRQAVVTQWLNANKPSEANGEKGTAAYQYVQKLKRNLALSTISQVLYKYLDEEYNIVLPEGAGASTEPTESSEPSGGGSSDEGGEMGE